MPDDHFGEAVAEHYDDGDPMFAASIVDPAVDLLVRLAAGGPALELGIGTGRIALQLAARGLEVHGLDLSESMVRRLRAKPGGDAIPVTIGDFSTVAVASAPAGSFALVYLVYNTIMNVTTQQGQVAVFRNAAAHLEAGGTFVIEVGVPDLQLLPFGETHRVFDFGERHIGIDEYDVVNQSLISHHFDIRDGQIASSSGPFRYVWPSELDLMADMAGLRLRERWADWNREPFTKLSHKHVSIWEKPPSLG